MKKSLIPFSFISFLLEVSIFGLGYEVSALPLSIKAPHKNYFDWKFYNLFKNCNFDIDLTTVHSLKFQRNPKPKLGTGTFTGDISFVGKDGKHVTDFWVKSGEYTLMLDARSAVIVGGRLLEGSRVRISYKNLKNSEMDIGRAFSGDAVKVVVLKK